MSEFQQIESRSNAQIKHARFVRDGQESGLIFIEGKRLVSEAVTASLRVRSLFVTEAVRHEMAAEIDAATRVGCPIFTVSSKVFEAVADTKSPQGIAMIADRPKSDASRFANLRFDTGFVVYLHETNNPNNFGAVLRTAEAAGCAGVISSPGSADPFSPKALRASMGSAFRVPIWSGACVDEVFAFANSCKTVPTAIALAGDASYIEADLKRPRILMFGSEAHGLPEEILRHDGVETITIPMATPVESLNLAASAAVVMFEARRQLMSKN